LGVPLKGPPKCFLLKIRRYQRKHRLRGPGSVGCGQKSSKNGTRAGESIDRKNLPQPYKPSRADKLLLFRSVRSPVFPFRTLRHVSPRFLESVPPPPPPPKKLTRAPIHLKVSHSDAFLSGKICSRVSCKSPPPKKTCPLSFCGFRESLKVKDQNWVGHHDHVRGKLVPPIPPGGARGSAHENITTTLVPTPPPRPNDLLLRFKPKAPA